MDWSIRRKPGSTDASIAASSPGAGAGGRLLPTSRLEAFSDGVFAIAITLLVLELHVPTGQEALVKGLEHEWPRYLGYFVSFAFIGADSAASRATPAGGGPGCVSQAPRASLAD